MKKIKIHKSFKVTLFLVAGLIIFWYVYRDLNPAQLKNELRNLNYWWIVLSFFLGTLSHISRAIRWNMLIRPLGFQPRVSNTFMAVMIMYVTNLAIPRAGEIARCSVLTKYEDVPFSKLIGTVVVERISDVIALFLFAFLIIIIQMPVFRTFLIEHPEMAVRMKNLLSTTNIVLAILAMLLVVSLVYLFRNRFKKTKLYKKIYELFSNFIEGIKTIKHLKNKWAYIGHTIFIYVMWLLMLYVVFFSFQPTSHLSIYAGLAAFVMGGLAMIAPVQGGIGPWHFMVYETLVFYGIAKDDGKIFALIAHTATNLSVVIIGILALILLPIVNNNHK